MSLLMRVQTLIGTRMEAHSHGYLICTDADQQCGLPVLRALGSDHPTGQASRLQSPGDLSATSPRAAGGCGRAARRSDARSLAGGELPTPRGKSATLGCVGNGGGFSTGQAASVHGHGVGHGAESATDPGVVGDRAAPGSLPQAVDAGALAGAHGPAGGAAVAGVGSGQPYLGVDAVPGRDLLASATGADGRRAAQFDLGNRPAGPGSVGRNLVCGVGQLGARDLCGRGWWHGFTSWPGPNVPTASGGRCDLADRDESGQLSHSTRRPESLAG